MAITASVAVQKMVGFLTAPARRELGGGAAGERHRGGAGAGPAGAHHQSKRAGSRWRRRAQGSEVSGDVCVHGSGAEPA